jgi:hypothetical protein
MADNFNLRTFLSENKLTKNAKLLKEEASFNGKPVNTRSIKIEGIDTDDYPDFVDAYITYAEYEDGTPLTDQELHDFQAENYEIVGELIHDRQLYLEAKKQASSGDMAYTEKVDEALAESKLTAKERRLVEMVQSALGEENVDYTMGRQDDPDQLPNPPAELNIPEGEVNIEEVKPLPKYNSIEELMKEIEAGTNEAAHSYKMKRMKEIAEMLEAKVGSLEEGEGADFVDAKKVKQMKKDIMTLRKQAEKLEKEYDKKFAKKEEKKETVKESKMENFDLKKFLVENKITTNSRMLNENETPTSLGIELGADLEVGMNTEPTHRPTKGGFSFKPASLDGGYKEAYIYIENQPELIEKLTTLYNNQEFDQLNSEVGRLVQQHTGESLESFVNTKLTTNSRMVNEEVEDIAYQALDHIKAAYNVMTSSDEGAFSEVTEALMDVVEMLEELAGDEI